VQRGIFKLKLCKKRAIAIHLDNIVRSSKKDAMGDHDFPVTCLSSWPHDNDVRDVVPHYYGCLGRDQEHFFSSLPPHKQDLVRKYRHDIGQARRNFENDPDGQVLVSQFQALLAAWRTARRWRPQSPLASEGGGVGTSSRLRRDTRGHGYNVNSQWFRNSLPHTHPLFDDKFPDQTVPLDDLLYNLNPKENPLMEPCPENMIRYFHFPANNMSWLEVSVIIQTKRILILSLITKEAIARYFHEEVPNFNDGRPMNRSKTYKVLQHEFWKGQRHVPGNSATTDQTIKPICEVLLKGELLLFR
jgi:hypothetical protein